MKALNALHGSRVLGPAIAGVLLLVPLVTNGYSQYVVNLVLINVIAGIGLNLLLGYAGQFAFASAALMGIGAYTTGLLATRVGLPYWACLPLSGVVAALLGAAAALPAMRMSRVYLALVTFAFAELVVWVLLNWKALTFGSDGISIPAPSLFGWKIRGEKAVFYLILACAAAMVLLAGRVLQSPVGRSFVALRESELVAQANGINVARTKTLVFALSAFFAGIAGSLYAVALGFIVPQSFGLSQLIVQFSIVALGGVGSLSGAVVGAVLLTSLPELLRELQGVQEIIYGLVLVTVVIFLPDGIAGALKQARLLPREVLVRDWRRLIRPAAAPALPADRPADGSTPEVAR
jgi:branched-chain amino acid transport system permease protein